MRFPISLVCLLISTLSLSAAPQAFFGDAALRAIQFVDDKEGWAVGDEGVIWHSIDGGETWERQSSGVRASLRAVHFLNPYTGWIVGRIEQANGISSGVVLTTSDGGLKWTTLSVNNMSGLNLVKFFTAQNGIAAGDGSDGFPTGLFITLDGGQSWKPIPGPRCPSWLAGDFVDAETGTLAGSWGKFAPVRNGLFGVSDIESLSGRTIRSLKLNGKRAVAVGDGGVVMISTNSGGIRWGFADLGFSSELVASLDLYSVANVGDHLWIVGRPGSFVLHSPDFGNSWELQSTGQSLPLHSVQFVDEKQGWAVGDMGTILSTNDGGKTWKVLRQEGQRAAVLFLHSDLQQMPLDVMAVLGHEEGYRVTALRFACADSATSSPKRAQELQRLQQAIRDVGGCCAESLWQFPLSDVQDTASTKTLIQTWDRLHGDKSTREMLRQLILSIRMWQPEVIVTDGFPASKGSSAILLEALKQSFKFANDPEVFPEQLKELKLKVCSVQKMYALLERADPTAPRMEIQGYRPRLGNSAKEFVSDAHRMLNADSKQPVERGFRLLLARSEEANKHLDLMEGTDLAFGGSARRKLPNTNPVDTEKQALIEKAHRTLAQMEQFAKGDHAALAKPEQALASIVTTLKDLPMDSAAKAAYAIAKSYADAGEWRLAQETFGLLVERYPGHPLCVEAYRWLVRFQSSSEARRREELGHYLLTKDTTFQSVAQENQPKNTNVQNIVQQVEARQISIMQNSATTKKWFQQSLALEPKLAGHGLLYVRDPGMQLCFQSSRRQLGQMDLAQKWLSKYLAETSVPNGGPTVASEMDPWRDCIVAESWLLNRGALKEMPKPLQFCPQALERPNLDGKLDDACWKELKPMNLKTRSGQLDDETGLTQSLATVASSVVPALLDDHYTGYTMVTYDADYLYIAVRCTHPLGKQVPKLEKRQRDADLKSFDRVSILLDLDRDYQTYFQFQIDQRGALAEDCWGDAKWNPKWYVAMHSEAHQWTAEIAIPRVELSGEAITLGKVWAFNATRIIPTKGIQAWSGPTDVQPRPEGMGLIQFIGEPK